VCVTTPLQQQTYDTISELQLKSVVYQSYDSSRKTRKSMYVATEHSSFQHTIRMQNYNTQTTNFPFLSSSSPFHSPSPSKVNTSNVITFTNIINLMTTNVIVIHKKL